MFSDYSQSLHIETSQAKPQLFSELKAQTIDSLNQILTKTFSKLCYAGRVQFGLAHEAGVRDHRGPKGALVGS